MQILECPQPITSSATSVIQAQVTIRDKLAMKWVSQTDGSRQMGEARLNSSLAFNAGMS